MKHKEASLSQSHNLLTQSCQPLDGQANVYDAKLHESVTQGLTWFDTCLLVYCSHGCQIVPHI